MFLEATLLSYPHSKSNVGHLGGEGMVIPSSGGCSLDNVSSIPILGDNPVNIGGSVQASVPSSSSSSLSRPSSTVGSLVPIPLPDVSTFQQVCSLLPREASPPPVVVVSSSGTIMALSSGDPSQSIDRIFRQHGISSSQSDDSNAERNYDYGGEESSLRNLAFLYGRRKRGDESTAGGSKMVGRLRRSGRHSFIRTGFANSP
ncbi:hypothetical protein LWI28_003864 [Acer negundo]|uniref:Uncharacterized protein n=1 Tax=Acer negundo TaxID=4023 RepID=A0AAD5II82_ACENE|nr:hypothetical protein LWI28_003864 [Acer negundo]